MRKIASSLAVLISCTCTQVLSNCYASFLTDDSDRSFNSAPPPIPVSALPIHSVSSPDKSTPYHRTIKAVYDLDSSLDEAREIVKEISGKKEKQKPTVPMFQKKKVEVRQEASVPIVNAQTTTVEESSAKAQEPAFSPLFSSALPRQNNTRSTFNPEGSIPLFSSQMPRQQHPAENVVGVDVTVPIKSPKPVIAEETRAEIPPEPVRRTEERPIEVDVTVPIKSPEPVIAEETRAEIPPEPVRRAEERPIEVDVTVPIKSPEPVIIEETRAEIPPEPVRRAEERPVEVDVTVPIVQATTSETQFNMQQSAQKEDRNVAPEVASQTPTTEQMTQEIATFLVGYFAQETREFPYENAIGNSMSAQIYQTGSSAVPSYFTPELVNSTAFVQSPLNYERSVAFSSLYDAPLLYGVPKMPIGNRVNFTLNPRMLRAANFKQQPALAQPTKATYSNTSKHNELTSGSVMFVRNLKIEDAAKKVTEDNATNFMNEIARFFFLLVAI